MQKHAQRYIENAFGSFGAKMRWRIHLMNLWLFQDATVRKDLEDPFPAWDKSFQCEAHGIHIIIDQIEAPCFVEVFLQLTTEVESSRVL